MSARYEFMSPELGFAVWDRDRVLVETDEEIPEGQVAVVFGDPWATAAVIVGEPAVLRTMLLQAHNQLPPGPEYVPAPTDVMRPRPRR